MSETKAELQGKFAQFSTYNTTPAKAFELVERARTRCPVPHSDELGGFHVFINYDDVRKGLLDWKTFGSSPSVFRPYVEGQPIFPPNSFDPPEHTPWRKVFSDGVNVRTPDRIEPLVRAYTIGCIEAFVGRGECDLATELAERVPMNAIFHILGLEPDLHAKVRKLTVEMLSSLDKLDEFVRLFTEFRDFGYGEVEKRRSDPRDDYLTVLADARLGERPLTPDEIGGAVIALLAAGHGTTTAALVNLFYEVLRRPALKQRLIDTPSLIPAAVEESLRLHHPFFGLYRQAKKDVEISGTQIKAGDSILMSWASADRDPQLTPNPLEFDIDREPVQHLAFGLGLHSCVGAPTARMEMRVVMEELLSLLPDIELVDPDAVAWEFHGAETSAIPSLPARFRARGA